MGRQGAGDTERASKSPANTRARVGPHAAAASTLQAPHPAHAPPHLPPPHPPPKHSEGHRSVGGMRASVYNAMPLEGAQQLAKFMAEFAATHGAAK